MNYEHLYSLLQIRQRVVTAIANDNRKAIKWLLNRKMIKTTESGALYLLTSKGKRALRSALYGAQQTP